MGEENNEIEKTIDLFTNISIHAREYINIIQKLQLILDEITKQKRFRHLLIYIIDKENCRLKSVIGSGVELSDHTMPLDPNDNISSKAILSLQNMHVKNATKNPMVNQTILKSFGSDEFITVPLVAKPTLNCWKVNKCRNKKCPNYQKKNNKCWQNNEKCIVSEADIKSCIKCSVFPVVGTLVAYKKPDQEHFSEQDLKVLNLIGYNLGLVIENHNVYKNLSRRIKTMKEVNNDLEESESKFRQLFNDASDGIITLDRLGRLTSANKKVLTLFGLSEEEILGKSFTKFTPLFGKSIILKSIKIFKDVILTGKIIQLMELKAKNTKGEDLFIEVSPSIIRENGKIQGLQVIIRDISYRKKLEKDLNVELENIQEANSKLQILYNLTKELNKEFHDPQTTLTKITDFAFDVLNLSKCDLCIYDETKTKIIFRNTKGYSKSDLRLLSDKFILHRTIEHMKKDLKPYIVKDTQANKNTAHLAKKLNTKSYITVPLVIEGDLRGHIHATRSNRQPIMGDDDLDFLVMIGEAATITIRNMQLYKELKDSKIEGDARLNQLGILNEVSKVIHGELNLKRRLDLIVDKVLEVLNAKMAFLVLTDENHELHYRLVRGIPDSALPPTLKLKLKIGEGVFGDIVKKGKGEIIPNFLEDNRIARPDVVKKQGIKSTLIVPLQLKQKVFGLLVVGDKKPNIFKKSDLNLLSIFGNHAAIAIETAQLYDKIQNFNKELKKEVKKATSDLKLANEELKKLDGLKSDFISTVSHELRTPLTSIKGYIALMLNNQVGDISKDQKDFLSIVNEETDRLTALITDLLDISKIEANRLLLKKEYVDLDNFVNDSKFNDLVKGNLKFNLIKEPNIVICADIDKLKQILINLVSNANKFTDKGSISLIVHDNNDNIRFSVQDTGIGIPEDDIPKIFEKFHQLENAATRKVGGTGLGLTIVRHLVEMHGGSITVDSKEGKGSTFSFTIPSEGYDST
ncbi:ATP-binding protein [Nanoarchaeota archaeon]